jgi:hypothetical protein
MFPKFQFVGFYIYETELIEKNLNMIQIPTGGSIVQRWHQLGHQSLLFVEEVLQVSIRSLSILIHSPRLFLHSVLLAKDVISTFYTPDFVE